VQQQAQRSVQGPHLQREILASVARSISGVERRCTSCTYRVACATANHAAHQPIAGAIDGRRRVAHTTHEISAPGFRGTAAVNGDQSVAFGALGRVVDVLWAHAAVLIQPLGGEVDGGELKMRRRILLFAAFELLLQLGNLLPAVFKLLQKLGVLLLSAFELLLKISILQKGLGIILSTQWCYLVCFRCDNSHF
jgi:hypothetical protein